jgi:hypothetical protein
MEVAQVYLQTTFLLGVTSKIVPVIPLQMSVFPPGSRWAPDMKPAEKSVSRGAVNLQTGSLGP